MNPFNFVLLEYGIAYSLLSFSTFTELHNLGSQIFKIV